MKTIFSRRSFLQTAALAPLVLLARAQTAEAQPAPDELPTVFTTKIGAVEISLLNERQQTGSKSILIGATPEILKQTAPDGTFPNAINAFLVRFPKRDIGGTTYPAQNILVDTGFGTRLFDNLKSFGLLPADIDIVLITHMHGDHIGGLLRDGKPAFPKAKIYISQPEHAYWTAPTQPQDSLQNRAVTAYKEHLCLFQPTALGTAPTRLPDFPVGTEIEALAAYGHTPGHTLFLVKSQDERLLIWADLTHAMAVQMPFPQVAVTYDVEPDQAIASRKKVLSYVAENKIPVAGMHIAFPGIGTVSPLSGKDSAYKFTPLPISRR
jgi:glyoxylase-like metal-dependent hydrolase (beta-lactamase superfamily II)